MKRILLAAGSEKSIDALSAMINSLADVEIVSSSYADKVKLMLEDAPDIDLVVINTPLLGSQGLELAAYAAQELVYPVLVLTGEETIKRVGSRLAEKGIVTVSRPIDRKAFAAALTQLLTVSSLIKAIRKKNLDLEEKIEETKLVNRAKALLIKHLKMTEDQAHRYIEKQAMDLRAEKRAVARNIIKTYYNR